MTHQNRTRKARRFTTASTKVMLAKAPIKAVLAKLVAFAELCDRRALPDHHALVHCSHDPVPGEAVLTVGDCRAARQAVIRECLHITVSPLACVSATVATGFYDAVLTVMPPEEYDKQGAFIAPAVSGVPHTIVPVADIGWLGDLHPARVPAARSRGIELPTPENAELILEFGRRALAAGWTRLIVHCFAGASRSPAAALLLFALEDGPGQESRSCERLAGIPYCNDSQPNLSLVRAGDVALGRNGKLFEACKRRFYRHFRKDDFPVATLFHRKCDGDIEWRLGRL